MLAFGGNLGDPAGAFRRAFSALEAGGFELEKISSFLRTRPVGCEPDAPDFLNGALSGYWSGTPEELLDLCQAIEAANGRPNEHARNRSRTLDLDIILFGEETIATPRLTIPHPRAGERDFVRLPVAEIAPELLFLLNA